MKKSFSFFCLISVGMALCWVGFVFCSHRITIAPAVEMAMAVETIHRARQCDGYEIEGLAGIVFPTNTLMVAFRSDVARAGGYVEFAFYIPGGYLVQSPADGFETVVPNGETSNEIQNIAEYYYHETSSRGVVLQPIPKVEVDNVQSYGRLNEYRGSLTSVYVIQTVDGTYVCGTFH